MSAYYAVKCRLPNEPELLPVAGSAHLAVPARAHATAGARGKIARRRPGGETGRRTAGDAAGSRCGITVTYRRRVPSPGWEKVRMRGIRLMGEAHLRKRVAGPW